MTKVFLSALLVLPLLTGKDVDESTTRMQEATSVLNEVMGASDRGIPHELLERAQCVGVVPSLKRVGFILGAKYGKGILTCRTSGETGWSAPSIIRIEGGSIGLQIGAGETDVVFAVMNERGVNRLMEDKFTFGGDASAMAGPVGRTANAETDAAMQAEILAWSRSRGVFAGVSLEGATVRPDSDDNEKLYHRAVTQRELLHGEISAPAGASSLYSTLNQYAPFKKN